MHWTGKVESVAFNLFGREVAWYGIIITSAMLLALAIAIQLNKKIKLKSEDLLEMFLFAIPLAILFARLGYVFSHASDFFVKNFGFDDFIEIFAVWDGGLTIMTGVPGGVLGGFIWARWRKVDFLRLADVTICVVLLAQAIGRWGNFFNQEIYGAPITNPNWQFFPAAVFIANKGGFYQATFFYESMMNLVGFFAMYMLSKRIYLKGNGPLLYVMFYGTIRFIMEFMRDDGDIYDKVPYTQIICAVVVVAAAVTFITLIVLKRKKGERVWYGRGIPPKLWKPAKYAIYKEGKTAEDL